MPLPRNVLSQLRRFLSDADPGRITSEQAVEVVGFFAEVERLGHAGKTLFADRAAESSAWVDEGHDSAASWLAELGKVPVGEAVSTLESSRALSALPGTAEVLKEGRLSASQVREVTRAARKDPSAESELLELAQHESLRDLRDRARQVMAQSASRQDEAARYQEICRRRYLRHWTDPEGAFRLDVRLAADVGARLLASVETESDAIFAEAKAQGRRELPDAYKADALVALVTGAARTGPWGSMGKGAKASSGARTDVVVLRVDAEVMARGHVKSGEVCEIPGVGPVPVAAVRRVLPEAFVKVVFHDTKDVKSVCHVGRTITAHTMTALAERDRGCVWPGCSVAHGLEAHHWREDFATSGITSLKELALVCAHHHDLVSYAGWVLEGGPGRWRIRGPGDQSKREQLEFADTG